jgi:hypothetical protein
LQTSPGLFHGHIMNAQSRNSFHNRNRTLRTRTSFRTVLANFPAAQPGKLASFTSRRRVALQSVPRTGCYQPVGVCYGH